jgi:hypothetical protein
MKFWCLEIRLKDVKLGGDFFIEEFVEVDVFNVV